LKRRGASNEFREFVLERVSRALCLGSLTLVAAERPVFAVEEPVAPTDLELSSGVAMTDSEDATLRFFRAHEAANATDGAAELLEQLGESEESTAIFSVLKLRALQFSSGSASEGAVKYLNDEVWRAKVFRGRSEAVLDPFVMWLMEWQLLRDDDWVFRTPHLLAVECEKAEIPDRRAFLFGATLLSAVCVDVASPVVRLVNGDAPVH
jgi:hypothetical protein